MANSGLDSLNGLFSEALDPYSALVQAIITLPFILCFLIASKILIVPITLVFIVPTGSSHEGITNG